MTDRELINFLLDVLENHIEDPRSENLIEKSCKLLRNRLEQPEPEPAFYVIQATDRFGEGYEQTYWEDPLGFPVYTRPVHAIDISQERVDETAKRKHEFFCPRCGHCCREWVGLTEHMKLKLADRFHISMDAVEAIEAKLKEKNT
jgi:hypothetical protein